MSWNSAGVALDSILALRYTSSQVQLVKRGVRPQLGDSVVVTKARDSRAGTIGTVVQDRYTIGARCKYFQMSGSTRAGVESAPCIFVQDDEDGQPFRLKFDDGVLSDVFYRERAQERGWVGLGSRLMHT